MTGRLHQLTTVTVGDEPDAWAAAGFTMTDAATRIGSTTIICDPTASPGIVHVSIDGFDADLDGLPVAPPAPSAPATDHANHVVGFDHLVVMSPAIDRTATALAEAGLEKRRTRTFDAGDETRRQDFYWLGDVILEVVGVSAVTAVLTGGPGAPTSPADPESATLPARFFGLALECDDLEAAAATLGDALGRIKGAVQPGRRIATVRTQELGVSVPIALMSPHRSE